MKQAVNRASVVVHTVPIHLYTLTLSHSAVPSRRTEEEQREELEEVPAMPAANGGGIRKQLLLLAALVVVATGAFWGQRDHSLAKDVPKNEPLATNKGQEPRYAPLGAIIGASAVVWAFAGALGGATVTAVVNGAGQFSAIMIMPVIAILGDRMRHDGNLRSEKWLEQSDKWREEFHMWGFIFLLLGLGFLLCFLGFGLWDRIERHQQAR